MGNRRKQVMDYAEREPGVRHGVLRKRVRAASGSLPELEWIALHEKCLATAE